MGNSAKFLVFIGSTFVGFVAGVMIAIALRGSPAAVLFAVGGIFVGACYGAYLAGKMPD